MNCNKVSDFFSGKFCIRLCFRLENGCAALKVYSPLTSGAIWFIKGFPYPVGKFTSEYIASAKKFCNCLYLLQIEVLNPKCRAYTRNGFNSCGISSRFSCATFSERVKFGNSLIQIIRVGRINQHGNQSEPLPGNVTGQHYRPVPSDVSLPRLSERRRRLKFRLDS